jgi:hypothetical protein
MNYGVPNFDTDYLDCISCNSNCSNCDYNATNCTSCGVGFYLYNNVCVPDCQQTAAMYNISAMYNNVTAG